MDHLGLDGEFARRKQRLLANGRGRVLELGPDLAAPDGTYDTVVLAHTLCRVADVDAAVRRVDELLAPGGQVLVLEHVRGTGLRRLTQDASAPFYKRTPIGCAPNRDPLGALRSHGFAITDCDRFTVGRTLPIVGSYVSAVAIRKATPPVEEDTFE